MKRIFFLIATAIILNACEDSTNNITPDLKKNNWKVSHYLDDNRDETYYFANWEFSFEDNGVVKATKGTEVVTGTWTEHNSSSGSNKLILNFGLVEPWDELTEDWVIVEKTNSVIKLEDFDEETNLTDLLHFTKL